MIVVFILSSLWWIRIRGLWKLPDGRDWLLGELDLVLMGEVMLSKSLIQFSVDGWGCVPPCCLIWGQTMVEVMETMETSFKRSHACTAALSAPDPAAGHHWPMPPPQTPGHSWASLGQSLVGSLLLSPGSWCAQGFVCALQNSVPPVLCKFWWLYGGVNGNLLHEGLCHTQVCIQSPCPAAGHCWPIPPQETLKSRSGSVSVGSPGVDKFLFEPSKPLWLVWGFILNVISPLLPSSSGFSFALGCEVAFCGGIQHSPVDNCSAANSNFGGLTWEDDHTSFFYSTILDISYNQS